MEIFMLVTLLAIAALILITGIENAFLIGIAALLTYLYPFTSITAIVLIAYLKWKGRDLKEKVTIYLRNKRKNK
jgi:hypothetical protein